MNEDKSARYHRLKRQASLTSLLWAVVLLGGLTWSGGSVFLRSLAESLTTYVSAHIGSGLSPHAASGFSRALVVVVYVALLMLVSDLGGLPLAFYAGFLLERRYGLSTERVSAWVRDQAKSFVIGLLLASAAAVIVYQMIAWSPGRWWLPAGLVFAGLIIGLTQVAPVVLLPLFYRIKPLEKDLLRARLLALAERAGARVLGAYEWGLSDKTKKANAALAGLGATRRILVSDTMLAEYSDEEIEVVLAHELAHHVHGDIWRGIVLESVLIVGGFYVAARVLESLAPAFHLRDVADAAGLPLLLLAAGAVSLVAAPARHAMSRAYERRADRFALALTRNPDAFISAMRRLGAQNLAEDHPSKLVQWLFYSHPPLRERIAAAEAFSSR